MTHPFPTRRSFDLIVPVDLDDLFQVLDAELGEGDLPRTDLRRLARRRGPSAGAIVLRNLAAHRSQLDQGRRMRGHNQSSRNARRRLSTTGWSRSEEHTSELQSLMRISNAVLCFKKNN